MGTIAGHKPMNVGIILISALFLLSLFIGAVSAQDSSIVGHVTDEKTDKPIVYATVTVFYYENLTVAAQTTTDSEGYYQITGLSPGTYLLQIEAGGYQNQSHEIQLYGAAFGEEETVVFDVSLNQGGFLGRGKPEEKGTDLLILYQMGIIITLILVASLVLYSTIKKQNLLKNAVRKRLIDYIRDNPGKHYRAILNDLDLQIGVLSYHLNRLEKAQFIRSRQDGMYRRFYIKGPKTEMRFFLSDIQESILTVIKENQGISQSNIGKKINVSRKVVNYHVNILDKAGFIFVENRGRESACYLVDPKTPIS
ncbi:MAG: carboxypeptidase regulatory-like domain-containing protein [Thermoplasmata archaeon]|nr:MAG: carboxypeptidase regulatory-like domain-containing protein [Thermoplasmata archaeon]